MARRRGKGREPADGWILARPEVPVRPGVDPSLSWLLGPGRDDFLPPRAEWAVPFLLRDPRGTPGKAEPRTVLYPARGLEERLAGAEFEALRETYPSITVGPPLPLRSTSPEGRGAPAPAGRGAGPGPRVVVGIIDDGLNFAHARYTRPDGTSRIAELWLQDGVDDGRSGFGYGRVITRAEIDALVAQATYAGIVDEDEVYRLAGMADFTAPERKTIAARGSHGAHVMERATDFDPADGIDWEVIGVQLPTAVTADTSGATLAPFAVDGLRFVRDRLAAREAAGDPVPGVVNFSYGITAGPHDGTHPIEAAFDDILAAYEATAARPLRVVLPAGNSHLGRGHAVVSFPAKATARAVPFRLQPDDRTPSFIEAWLPGLFPGSPRMALSLETPDGLASPPLPEGSGYVLRLMSGGKVLCEAGWYRVDPAVPRGMFLISLQPTARLAPGPVVAHGRWFLRLDNVALKRQDEVHLWIQRDDTPYGYPVRGRQAVFEDACPRLDRAGREIETDTPGCLVQRGGGQNAIASGARTIVVGALLGRELRASAYSAGGPLRPGSVRVGPDALALADDSRVHAGVLGSGTRSGSVVVLNGTSVAAPLVTCWVARELAFGRPGDRAAVAGLATAQEGALNNAWPNAPALQGPGRAGAGRIILRPARPRPRDRRIQTA